MADVYARIREKTIPLPHAVLLLGFDCNVVNERENLEAKTIEEWLDAIETRVCGQMFREKTSRERVDDLLKWHGFDLPDQDRLGARMQMQFMRETPSLFREENGLFYCIEDA